MQRALGLGLCLLLISSSATSARPIDPVARFRSLAVRHSCPGFGKIDLAKLPAAAWTPPPTALPAHRDLRTKLQAPPLPEVRTRVMLSWSGGHHSLSAGSLVLARQADGAWRADGVNTVQLLVPTPLGAPERPIEIQRAAWVLQAAEGAKLDALIAGPCLEAEPRDIQWFGGLDLIGGGRSICSGGAVTTLDVLRGDHGLVSRQHCGRWGTAGEIIGLVLDSQGAAGW